MRGAALLHVPMDEKFSLRERRATMRTLLNRPDIDRMFHCDSWNMISN